MFSKRIAVLLSAAILLLTPLQAVPAQAAANQSPTQTAMEQNVGIQWIDNGEFTMKVPGNWKQTDSFSGLGGAAAISPSGQEAIEVNLIQKQAMRPYDIQTAIDLSETLVERSLPLDCLDKEPLDYQNGTLVGKAIVWTGCQDIGSLALVMVSQTQGQAWTVTAVAFSPGNEWKTFTTLAFNSLTLIGAKAIALTDLNIRSGPATTYRKLNVVPGGSELIITGASSGCQWVRILLNDGSFGWVAGGKYILFTQGGCVPAGL